MWRIVSDSSCDLHSLPGDYPDIDFVTIPFNITIGPNEYTDDENINLTAMMEDNEQSPEIAQTACASPEAWSNEFLKGDKVLAFTISSALSGSYSSACTGRTMAEESNPDIKVGVIDSKGTGPELAKLIMKACELISSDMDFDDVVKALDDYADETKIIFALASYHNLIKNGRVSRLKGLVAGHLNFWGIGVGDEKGEIAMRGKAHGEKKMIKFLVNDITTFKKEVDFIVISHCFNEGAANLLKERLIEAYGDIPITILPTRGLDSFYAERNGLIIAY